MEIKKATKSEIEQVAKLAVKMWDSSTVEELSTDFEDYVNNGGIVFLAYRDNKAIAFAQCGLRRDYVEGTESSPVGYLEGIYVVEEERLQGVAKQLLNACQNYAKEQGCTEFASDCELKNEESLRFHLKMGFVEANRIICFNKKL